MLSKEVFKKSLDYLSKFYVSNTFKEHIAKEDVLEIWYGVFKNIDEMFFIEVIKDYALNTRFAPNSPRDLLEHIENIYIAREVDFNVAFDRVLELRREFRDVSDGRVRMPKVLGALEKDSPIYIATHKIRDRLILPIDLEQQQFIKRDFQKIYESEIIKKAKNQLLRLSDVGLLKLGV